MVLLCFKPLGCHRFQNIPHLSEQGLLVFLLSSKNVKQRAGEAHCFRTLFIQLRTILIRLLSCCSKYFHYCSSDNPRLEVLCCCPCSLGYHSYLVTEDNQNPFCHVSSCFMDGRISERDCRSPQRSVKRCTARHNHKYKECTRLH